MEKPSIFKKETRTKDAKNQINIKVQRSNHKTYLEAVSWKWTASFFVHYLIDWIKSKKKTA